MEKIKSFREFITESFKSGKLREIIKQNGYPKYSIDKELLHDIQDEDIFCVLNNEKEYYEKRYGKVFGQDYDKNFKNTFSITLQNGKELVIKNFDAYKSYIDDGWKEYREKIKSEIRKRRGFHDTDHIDKLAKKHKNSVYNEQERRKFLNEFLTDENKKEISNIIEDTISSVFVEDSEGKQEKEIDDFKINGEDVFICVNYTVRYDYERVEYGVKLCDMSCTIDDITIYFNDSEIEADGFKDDIYSGKTEFEERDVELEITDYYAYYGVSPSDFI